VTKAEAVALTEALGIEWAKRGVRVVAITLGVVATPMAQAVFAQGIAARSTYERRTPMHRLGTVDEIAEAALFLAAMRLLISQRKSCGSMAAGRPINYFRFTILDFRLTGFSMKITGADHTSFTVSNLEQSIAFYVENLGFELLYIRPEIKNNYFRAIIGWPDAVVKGAVLAIPGTTHQLELFEYVHPRGVTADVRTNNPGSAHVAYFVDDLNAFYTALSAKGVRFRSPPVVLDEGPNRGGVALYMLDPDGITIELFQRGS
jgi:catechol 2,3-dioxygenase-like lactoylglutathione lyase family enzyme